MFGGRVKTLHPKLFGGILFNRSEETHRGEAQAHGVGPIDLVVVNLYPFEETVAQTGATFAQAIEKIDVGGPSLLRAAAKNHAHVGVVCDPADYPAVAAELAAHGGALSGRDAEEARREGLPPHGGVRRRDRALDLGTRRASISRSACPSRTRSRRGLRYGENPHQKAALYADPAAHPAALSRYAFVQGKELSYNNFLDADAALYTSRVVGPNALTIVKHRIPSGRRDGEDDGGGLRGRVGVRPDRGLRRRRRVHGHARRARPRPRSRRASSRWSSSTASRTTRSRSSRRSRTCASSPSRPKSGLRPRLEARGIDGGLLVQEGDLLPDEEAAWKVVTKRAPTEAERRALRFANLVLRGVVSNGIVVAGETATYGIGGGRTSRVDACRDAAGKAGERAKGAVAASDAFFPFPDGLEVLAGAGVTAVIQPGGSVKDPDVIAAADARGNRDGVHGKETLQALREDRKEEIKEKKEKIS